MKDAARLLAYLVATVLVGALLAPPLFWGAQWLAAQGVLPFLARFGFESFFHRALLVAGLLLLWPLLRSLRLHHLSDLGLAPNPRWSRHLASGFVLSSLPLLCCGAILIVLLIYKLRSGVSFGAFANTIAASATVPIIEEAIFRGLILGVLLRSGRIYLAIFVTSALYSVIHFLKTPDRPASIVTWSSGFDSLVHSFAQFSDPVFVLAGFTTLFLIGWILADARVRTRSLWLPIGLHAGWIFANGTFNRIAHREMVVLPWLGKNLLVGIVPLGICFLTWGLVRGWLKYDGLENT